MYVGVGMAFVAIAGAVAGWSVFGLHPLTTLSGGQVSVAHGFGLIALAYLIGLAGMACIVSLAVLLSTLTDSSLTAAVGALVLVLVLQALGQFSYFDFLKPYLFTSHFEDWFNLLRQPISWAPIWKALVTFAVYIVGLVRCSVGSVPAEGHPVLTRILRPRARARARYPKCFAKSVRRLSLRLCFKRPVAGQEVQRLGGQRGPSARMVRPRCG